MESKITVIIPIWNLKSRGLDRVKWSIHSILNQTIPVNIIVYDTSTQRHNTSFSGKGVTHIRKPKNKLHIPFMMNRGIELSQTEYIATTGADFVFRQDFFETALSVIKPNGAVFCEVDEMKRAIRLNPQFMAKWEFPKILYQRNRWGRTAPGAINLMHRDDWVKTGGYNEDFISWGGYDNEFFDHVCRLKMKRNWIEKFTQVIHLWHRQEKAPKGKDRDTWNKNQKLHAKHKRNGRPAGSNWLKMGVKA